MSDHTLQSRRVTTEVEGRQVSGLVWSETESTTPPAPPRLAFLHGMGLNAHTFDSTVAALGRPALVLDLPGHGDSTWRDDIDYRPQTIAPAVLAALEAEAARPVVVVGQSLGALTAAAVAELDPADVAGLVLVDMSPGIRPGDAAPVGAFLAGPQVFDSREELVDRAVAFGIGHDREALARGVFHNTRIRDDGKVIWKHHFANLPEGRTPVAGDPATLWPALEGATVPILLIWGSTGYLSPEVIAEFRQRLPKATVVEVEAGHNVQEHAPDALAHQIATWASENGLTL